MPVATSTSTVVLAPVVTVRSEPELSSRALNADVRGAGDIAVGGDGQRARAEVERNECQCQLLSTPLVAMVMLPGVAAKIAAEEKGHYKR